MGSGYIALILMIGESKRGSNIYLLRKYSINSEYNDHSETSVPVKANKKEKIINEYKSE